MPGEPDLKDILKKNPQVDAGKLREGCELSKKLSEAGTVRRGSRLASPGGDRKAYAIGIKGEVNAVQLRTKRA